MFMAIELEHEDSLSRMTLATEPSGHQMMSRSSCSEQCDERAA
jgi:hypothetical protein